MNATKYPRRGQGTRAGARRRGGALPPPANARSDCPVACALDLFGDKWTLLVLRDLLAGKSQFKEFLASPEGIATNILSERLSRLAENGLVERYPSSEHLGRDAYRLTEKGRSVRGLIAQLKAWGLQNIRGTEARIQVRD